MGCFGLIPVELAEESPLGLDLRGQHLCFFIPPGAPLFTNKMCGSAAESNHPRTCLATAHEPHVVIRYAMLCLFGCCSIGSVGCGRYGRYLAASTVPGRPSLGNMDSTRPAATSRGRTVFAGCGMAGLRISGALRFEMVYNIMTLVPWLPLWPRARTLFWV